MQGISIEYFINNASFVNYCLAQGDADIQFWEDWLESNPLQAEIFEEAKERIQGAAWLLIAEKEKAAAMEKLDQYLLQPARKSYWKYAWYAAAAVLILVFVGLYLQGERDINPLAKQEVQQQFPLYYKATENRQGFVLPDNSFVLLEKGSELQLDSAFGKWNRDMNLSGIAYFKASADEHLPFAVHAGDYLVTALGTAFKVQTDQQEFRVLLESGKVKVEHAATGKLMAVLEPGQSYMVNLTGGSNAKGVQQTFSPQSLNTWKAEELIFDQSPVPDVIEQLEACYNIEIDIQDSTLLNETFTGRFKHDELKDVMDVLCFTLKKQYSFKDANNIEIK